MGSKEQLLLQEAPPRRQTLCSHGQSQVESHRIQHTNTKTEALKEKNPAPGPPTWRAAEALNSGLNSEKESCCHSPSKSNILKVPLWAFFSFHHLACPLVVGRAGPESNSPRTPPATRQAHCTQARVGRAGSGCSDPAKEARSPPSEVLLQAPGASSQGVSNRHTWFYTGSAPKVLHDCQEALLSSLASYHQVTSSGAQGST